MTELSYRVPRGMHETEILARERRLRAAYDAYAASTPFPGSRHTPPLYIEAFPSAHPYTEHGKIRGVVWLPEGKTLDPWWHGAVQAVMRALLDEFPERGVVFYTDREGSALKLQPVAGTAAA